MVLALADNLGAEGGLGAAEKLGVVVLEDVELLLNFIDSADSDFASLLEAVSDSQGVDAFFQKFLGLLKNGASKDDNTSGSITDFIVLGGGKLGKKACSLMVDLAR